MFFETSYLGDIFTATGGGASPLWQQQGFASKAAWVAQGRPGVSEYIATLPGGVVPGGWTSSGSGDMSILPPPGGYGGASSSTSGATGAGAAAPGSGAKPSSGGGGIPTTWLIIGGVIVALMVFKK